MSRVSLLLLCFISLLISSSLCVDHANGRGDQPLAQINMYNTSLALDTSIYLHASPHVLGLQGEDTEWVDVAIDNPNFKSDDWVAVFSPAKFDASACWNTNGKEKAPFLCTSPIKYMFPKNNPEYLKSGKVILKFQIINQRADISFALFAGNLWSPKLIAVSNTITFVNPKAPVYPRLALGKSWDEMTVTWTSGYSINEAVPFIEWSSKGFPSKRTPAGTITFNRNTVCENAFDVYIGDPARSVGWRDPGFFHTTFLKELWPNREYIYRLGHDLVNGSTIWSKNFTFKSSPFPGQDSLQRVIIFGDMGKGERDGSNEYNDYQPGSISTTDQVIKDLDNIDIVFHIGDLTYANGYLSQWDQFTAQVEPVASKVPYMIASGNHERTWPDSGSFYTGQDSGGECGVPAETMFYFPAENRAKFWYSADYGMFRFCVADTEHDWREGTEQYQFIERCLATVDRKTQPWLIFIAHRVLGYSSNDWYGKEGTYEEPMGRESLQKLWQKYKVDIAFYGHVHNYERTCPVYQSQCVDNGKDHYSGTFKGTIHVVAGGAGCHLAPFSSLIPKWSLVRDYDFGFVKLTATDHSSLLFEYKKSSNGQVHDSFNISRDYRDVLACTHDSCEATTSAS
ncbi:unnamed protein product [Cochlearia groenlandica]